MFDGKGFERDEFEPQERSELRHLLRVMAENFTPLSASQLKTLENLDIMRRAWPMYVAAVAVAASLKLYGVL